MRRAEELVKPYLYDGRGKFRLKDHHPEGTGVVDSKEAAQDLLRKGVDWLAEEQEKLYAQDKWGVLLVFQAMDAAGKDSTIEHVMSGVNPQGCQVFSFKAPSSEDLDHDYLWRCSRCLPERGRIGIFNRSYYEEVLVVRVHPEYLTAQKLPERCVGKDIWNERFEDIRGFERYLSRQGYVIRKFFLNVSKEEQCNRFLKRLEEPEKNWKFSAADVAERKHWDAYMDAYEEMIGATAAPHAPWIIVPADKKWYARMVVAAAIVDALDDLNLEYPKVGAKRREELKEIERQLRKNGGGADG